MQSSKPFSARESIDDPELAVAVNGRFFGSALPAARIEGLIAAHVPRTHIAEVADVYGTKWWDYRRLAPGHCFLLFAHHYYQAFKLSARRMLWHRRQSGRGGAGVGLLGVNSVDYSVETIWDRDQAHTTGMWKAMLTCDALGIPYDHYCRLACQIAIDTAWKQLPRPTQLYSPKLGGQILDEWLKLTESRLFIAKHPIYLAVNYEGLAIQDQYRAYLIDQIERRGDPVTALLSTVYKTPQLPVALAEKHFPANVMNRARLLAI